MYGKSMQTKSALDQRERNRASHLVAGLIVTILCLGVTPVWASDSQLHPAATKAALNVLDQFMTAFNQRDINGWAATLNYPHVRFASGTVKIWNTEKEFRSTPPFRALAKLGWDHSHWLHRKIVMASPTKVHIATTFERFDDANQSLGVYESLYIVTRVKGDWGIQSRSSLAP